MLKINPVRVAVFTAALITSTAALAQNSLQKQKNTFLTEQPGKFDINQRDEFVPQKKTANYAVTTAPVAVNRAASLSKSTNPDFDKAVDYYNRNMNYSQRSSVTTKTYENLQTRLYNMEKAIDNAYIDCEAYGDIMIVPRWHYRFYPFFEDKLINFDVDDVRVRTAKDMDSLYELKDKVEYIIEEANGETEHTTPAKTDYDVDALAQKYFGMSYQELKEKYSEELEFCKTVTYADLTSMTETQRYVYGKAKAYVKEMLQITINEAHTTNWNIGERKLAETMKASGDMYTISDFEDEGIDENSLAKIESGMMFKAFEEALIDKYNQLLPTSVDEINADNKPQKPVKRLVNGEVRIFNPDGSVYNLNGKRII